MVKFRLFIVCVFALNTCYAVSGIEEQRKYIVNPIVLNTDKITLITPFVFHPHSQYITYDIYFDSREWEIRNTAHSFRLRRVEKKKGKWEYYVQLKTEMAKLGEIRTELEFKDFSKQKVGEEKLTDLMDRFIADESARDETAKKLATWIARKKNSSLSPFHKLSELGIDVTSLRPIVWGKSIRQRYHVYTQRNSPLARTFFIKNSEKNIFMVPEFFKKQKDYIWLMEASYDQAVFKDLLSGKPGEWPIYELEIENKYRPRKFGTLLLNELEKKMSTVWDVKTNKDSKYVQSSTFFYPERK